MAENEIVRSQLVSTLVKKFPQLAERDVEISVNQVLEYMIEALCQKRRIEIRDFGCFYVTERSARKAHNPKTGDIVITKDKYALRFKAGKGMRDRINATQQQTEIFPEEAE